MLREEWPRGMPDCGVLLTTERTEADVATFDTGLAQVAAERGVAVRSESLSRTELRHSWWLKIPRDLV